MKTLAVLLGLLLGGAGAAAAAQGPELELARAPVRTPAQLRDGARVFLGNCVNCHGARFVRGRDLGALGFTPQELAALLPAGRDPSDALVAVLAAEQARIALGQIPPDLSDIASSLASGRGSGADFIYTLLRSYEPAPQRPGGWNNRLLPGLAMPNPFPPGAGDDKRYDDEMADVAAFLQWLADPGREQRRRLAGPVLGFLLVFAGLAFAFRVSIWKKPQ